MGLSQLAWLRFEVSQPAEWHHLLGDVLGLVATGKGRYRMDERPYRIEIMEGPADDLVAMGWEVEGNEALGALKVALGTAGVETAGATAAECAERGVDALVRFADPQGVPIEVCTGFSAIESLSTPLVPGGFVTGEQGMGHLVLSGHPSAKRLAFYMDLLGMRLSDQVITQIYGHPVHITFLHANSRHHSLAIGGPPPKRVHHFLVEYASMDDLGMAFTRACKAGVEIVLTLGKHPNDGMFSFYARTPSGIEFEAGWGGRRIDDADWTPVVHDRVSAWGHIPPQLIPRRKEPRT